MPLHTRQAEATISHTRRRGDPATLYVSMEGSTPNTLGVPHCCSFYCIAISILHRPALRPYPPVQRPFRLLAFIPSSPGLLFSRCPLNDGRVLFCCPEASHFRSWSLIPDTITQRHRSAWRPRTVTKLKLHNGIDTEISSFSSAAPPICLANQSSGGSTW